MAYSRTARGARLPTARSKAALPALLAMLAGGTAAARPASVPEAIRRVPEDALTARLCPRRRPIATLRCRDPRHFVSTNEFDHNLWRPHITGLGGIYAGVGAEHQLTFVAWARSKIAFLLDYDPVVVRINLVHLALLQHSPDPRTFVGRFDAPGEAASLAILRRSYGDHPEATAIVAAFRAHRPRLARYFRMVLGRQSTGSHWLHRTGDYRYLRTMAREGRIRAMKGDLLGDRALRGIGKLTSDLRIPLRVLYLSNCEQFWARYPTAFRRNISSLVMDQRSVVLRTWRGKRRSPKARPFAYVVQAGPDLQHKLVDRSYPRLATFQAEARPEGDVMRIGKLGSPGRRPRLRAPQQCQKQPAGRDGRR